MRNGNFRIANGALADDYASFWYIYLEGMAKAEMMRTGSKGRPNKELYRV